MRNAKHYEVKLQFLQQLVVDNGVEFAYCNTNSQLADFFTKPPDATKSIHFRNQLMAELRLVALALVSMANFGQCEGCDMFPISNCWSLLISYSSRYNDHF